MTSLPEHIAELIRNGEKLQAIKLLVDETGIGLREAKDAVERMDADPAFDPIEMTNEFSGVSEEVQQLAWEGKKIHAIKLLMEESGLDLKDAKVAVEQLQVDPMLPKGMKTSPVIVFIIAISLLVMGLAMAILFMANG